MASVYKPGLLVEIFPGGAKRVPGEMAFKPPVVSGEGFPAGDQQQVRPFAHPDLDSRKHLDPLHGIAIAAVRIVLVQGVVDPHIILSVEMVRQRNGIQSYLPGPR